MIFTPYRILVIDDKPSNFAYFANKLQVWGYCLAFKELHRPRLPLFRVLEERGGEIVWMEEFQKKKEKLVADKTNRLLAILTGKERPTPTDNLRKCKSCQLKIACGN